MSFQVGIGSLSGTVFFQVGLCTLLWTMVGAESIMVCKYKFSGKFSEKFLPWMK